MEERHMKKVIKGKVTVKKSTAKEVVKSFIAEDLANVKHYVIFDLIIPEIKKTIIGGMEMLFWGKAGKQPSNSIYSPSKITYVNYSNPSTKPKATTAEIQANRLPDYDEMYLDEEDADTVLSMMREILDRYGRVRLAEMYELAGYETGGNYTYNRYGWTNLSNASVERNRYGWRLNLPRPVPLER